MNYAVVQSDKYCLWSMAILFMLDKFHSAREFFVVKVKHRTDNFLDDNMRGDGYSL